MSRPDSMENSLSKLEATFGRGHTAAVSRTEQRLLEILNIHVAEQFFSNGHFRSVRCKECGAETNGEFTLVELENQHKATIIATELAGVAL